MSGNPWHFTTHDLGYHYRELISDVLQNGDTVKPRGMAVKEVRPLYLTLLNPQQCLTFRPQINRALMWMEIAQILAGDFNAELFNAISPLASKLLTAGGAYGPRTALQLTHLIQEMTDDPDSRRAIVYIGRPDDLSRVRAGGTTDQPCTATWQFFSRNGKLEMAVNMRSWDLVWGLANDIPCFVSVQMAVAAALGLEVGPYYHVAGSGHIYERHWDLVDSIRAEGGKSLPSVGSTDGDTPSERWTSTVHDAVSAVRAAHLRDWGSMPVQWREAGALWKKKIDG